MVKKKLIRGNRKHTYVAEKDFFHSFMAYFCQMWDREVNKNMEAIDRAEKLLMEIVKDESISDSIRQEAKSHYELLKDSESYYRWLKRLVESIRSEEIYKFIPKE